MSRVYLTVEQVVEIHDLAIDRFGGTSGILDKHALESALGRFRSGYYNDLFEEAAALLESLATNHPFLDGNKRTAFFAADSFLRSNGYFIDCDADEANRFIRNILVDRRDRFDRVRNWLKAHVKPTPS